MKTYRLTKVKIKDGMSSAVREGKSAEGNLLRKFETEDDFDFVKDCSLDDIKIQDEVCVDYQNMFGFLKTSPVYSIEVKSPTMLLLETGTSYYELEEIQEE